MDATWSDPRARSTDSLHFPAGRVWVVAAGEWDASLPARAVRAVRAAARGCDGTDFVTSRFCNNLR